MSNQRSNKTAVLVRLEHDGDAVTRIVPAAKLAELLFGGEASGRIADARAAVVRQLYAAGDAAGALAVAAAFARQTVVHLDDATVTVEIVGEEELDLAQLEDPSYPFGAIQPEKIIVISDPRHTWM